MNNSPTTIVMMNSISPNIFVKDIDKTIDYYKQLGFTVVASVPDNGPLVWAMMNCGSINFMFQTYTSLGNDIPAICRQDGGSLLLYIQVKGIRKYFDKIKDNVEVVKELEKTFYGATEFAIRDLNNYILTFAEDE